MRNSDSASLETLEARILLVTMEFSFPNNVLNTDLLKGFTVPQVAEKHAWTEPAVWSLALEALGAQIINITKIGISDNF